MPIISERPEGTLRVIESVTRGRTVQVDVEGVCKVSVGSTRFDEESWPAPRLHIFISDMITLDDWAKVNNAVAFVIAEYDRRFGQFRDMAATTGATARTT